MRKALALLFSFAVLSSCLGDNMTRTLYTRGQFEFYIINRTIIRSARCREFTRISKSVTAPFLKEFDVYAVKKSGYYGCFLMPEKGIPIYFDDLPDAAAFLSDRVGKVKSQDEAEKIMRLLPALFAYTITEPTPNNNFSYEMKPTDSGWQLTCRYLVFPEFKTYFQATITLDREGHLAVPDLKFGGSLFHPA